MDATDMVERCRAHQGPPPAVNLSEVRPAATEPKLEESRVILPPSDRGLFDVIPPESAP